MQVLINIDKDVFEKFKKGDYTIGLTDSITCEVEDAVKQGKKLPKKHGDLIDRSKLLKHPRAMGLHSRSAEFLYVEDIKRAKAVIEANYEKS